MNAANLTGAALVEAHRSAVRRLRILAIIFPLAFIALIASFLMSVANQIASIDQVAVGAGLSNRVNVLVPEINSSVGEIADAVQPALTHALETESLALAPKIEQRLQSDVDHGITRARTELQNTARGSMERLAAAQRALVVRELPQLEKDKAAQDKILAAAHEATLRWEAHQLDTTIAEHVVAIEELRKTLESHYTHPTDRPADPEEALMTWLNLMNEHVGGEEGILDGEDAKAGKRPAGKK